MSKGVNRVILLGYLGKDIEKRFTASGGSVANTSLATSEQWKDKTTGQKQEKTEWHNLVFFGKLADVADQYLKKGSLIYVEGKLTTDKWRDKEGKDRFTTKIHVNELQMLDGKPDVGASNERGEERTQAPVSRQSTNDFDDFDIPF